MNAISMGRSRSRSRSYSRSLTRSRSRSPEPSVRRDDSSPTRGGGQEREREKDSRRLRSRSPRRNRRDSRSPAPRRRKHFGTRENPDPSKCLGVFNLSKYTTEKDVRDLMNEYGEIERVQLVYDHPTGQSRGFGFVYFQHLDDATRARDKLQDVVLDGQKLRIDYSMTKRAHTPTPGQYMGDAHQRHSNRKDFDRRDDRRGGRDHDRRDYDRRDDRRDRDRDRDYGRRRSPSPRYERRRSPSPYDRGYY